jgi:hypothetical protein
MKIPAGLGNPARRECTPPSNFPHKVEEGLEKRFSLHLFPHFAIFDTKERAEQSPLFYRRICFCCDYVRRVEGRVRMEA